MRWWVHGAWLSLFQGIDQKSLYENTPCNIPKVLNVSTKTSFCFLLPLEVLILQRAQCVQVKLQILLSNLSAFNKRINSVFCMASFPTAWQYSKVNLTQAHPSFCPNVHRCRLMNSWKRKTGLTALSCRLNTVFCLVAKRLQSAINQLKLWFGNVLILLFELFSYTLGLKWHLAVRIWWREILFVDPLYKYSIHTFNSQFFFVMFLNQWTEPKNWADSCIHTLDVHEGNILPTEF